MDAIFVSGTVKFYLSDKGYGFLTSTDGTDFFIGQAALSRSGIDRLWKGDRVRFLTGKAKKGGVEAINVERLTDVE